MPTGTTPIAMAASALPQPRATTLVGLLVISVLPKAWSMVTASKEPSPEPEPVSSPSSSARAPQALSGRTSRAATARVRRGRRDDTSAPGDAGGRRERPGWLGEAYLRPLHRGADRGAAPADS